jgi:hypothetical protein
VQGAMAVKLLTAGVEIPPALVATAVTEARPAGNVIAEVEYAPVVGSAVTLTGPPVLPGPPLMVTTALGVAVPEMVGESVAVPLVAGVVMATVGGAGIRIGMIELTHCGVGLLSQTLMPMASVPL